MIRIKRFIESISGTELVGPMGPNYGPTNLPSKPNTKDTDVIYSDNYGKAVTYDQYQELYQDYLKKGGKPIHGFNLQNLEIVLLKLNESISGEDITEYFLELSDLGAIVEFDEDFDGKGTPCLEIILVNGYNQYRNTDTFQFIVDLYTLSNNLLDFTVHRNPLDSKSLSEVPISKKINTNIVHKYTKGQIDRLEKLHNLIIKDISLSYSEYEDGPTRGKSFPMFRIKFLNPSINEMVSDKF